MFGKTWEPARGTVIDSRVARAKITEHSRSVTKEFVVEVTPSAGEPFRVVVPEGNYADFWAPKIGQSVALQIEAKSNKVRFDKSDSGLSFQEHERRAAEGFDASLNPDRDV